MKTILDMTDKEVERASDDYLKLIRTNPGRMRAVDLVVDKCGLGGLWRGRDMAALLIYRLIERSIQLSEV